MVIVFDLDGTIADTEPMHYDRAKPRAHVVALVNRLYDQGHRIVIDTSRGWGANRDFLKVTREQLAEWGVKYHGLRCGRKIPGDYYVDSKAVTPEALAASI